MSFITQAEALRRLRSPTNLANSLPLNPLSKQNDPVPVLTPAPNHNTPPLKDTSLRALVGICAKIDGPAVAAKELGVTVQQAESAGHSKNKEVAGRVSATTERIRELALTKLMESLGLLTEDKLANASLNDLSKHATNLSRIVSNLTPSATESGVAAKTLIIYAPPQRVEKDYQVLDI